MNGQDIKTIVEGLNSPPLSKDLTLVSFDQLTPEALIALLNEVFYALDPKTTPSDLREEAPEYTAYRMADFLRVLGYKVLDAYDGLSFIDLTQLRTQFQMLLIQGERSVIYPVLSWLLPKFSELQKRAFLAFFLVNIEIPPEFFSDQSVMDTYNQYKGLQDVFKETHKGFELQRKSARNPAEFRVRISRGEEERDQLNQKISVLHKRTADTAGFDSLFAASGELRKEIDDAARLEQQLVEQRQMLVTAQHQHREVSNRLADLKVSTVQGSSDSLVAQLRQEVHELAVVAEKRLPEDIHSKQERLQGLQKVMSETGNADYEVQRLTGELNDVTREIQALSEKKMSTQVASTDEKLVLYRQQAGLVAAKKQEAFNKFSKVKEALQAIETELNEKEKYLSSFRGSAKAQVLKGQAFKEYAAKLREKNATYKRLRADLDKQVADLGILQRTEQILQGQEADMVDRIATLEKKRGVTGYEEMQSRLADVSQKKSEVDEGKERTLTEVSKVVTEINSTLAERKAKLAPLIKELRALRAKHNEVETDFLEKKSVYDNTSAGLESDRMKLEQEVTAYTDECQREEGRYHTLHCMMSIIDANLARVQQEEKSRTQLGSKAGKSLKERYASRLAELESQTKEWRDKQKRLKESLKPNSEQVAMFSDLRKLLQMKQQSVATPMTGDMSRQPLDLADVGRSVGGYGAPTSFNQQVDRLVL